MSPIYNRGPCACCQPCCKVVGCSGFWWAAPGLSDYVKQNGETTSVRFIVQSGGVEYDLAYTLSSGPALILSGGYPDEAPFPQSGGSQTFEGTAMFDSGKRVKVTISGATMVKLGEKEITFTNDFGTTTTWTQAYYTLDLSRSGCVATCEVADA